MNEKLHNSAEQEDEGDDVDTGTTTVKTTTKSSPFENKPTKETPAKEGAPEKKSAPAKLADGSPFFRNFVDSTEKKHSLPENSNEPLEREQNYSKAEEITRLVNEIQSGEFERAMRDKRYKELYGNSTEIGAQARSYLDGSGHWEVNRGPNGENLGMRLVNSDFDYNEQTGTLEYNLGNSILRRLSNIGAKIGVKALITGGIGLAIGMMTGPAGMAAVLPMLGRVLIGSGLGRLSVEIARMFDRAERDDRAKLEIADIRYHQKTHEIGNRVACYRDNHPTPADRAAHTAATGMPSVGTSQFGEPLYHDAVKNENITIEEWDIRQTQATKDLVNFVYSYERNAIDIQYDSEGRPMVHPTATPNPPGEARPYGTEVQQASNRAVDTVVIGDLRDRIEARRKNWETASEIGEAIGGVSYTAFAILNGGWSNIVGNAFDHLKDRFAAGDVINHVDINGDFVNHAIQHTDNLGNIYHLNSMGEQMSAVGAGSDISHQFGQFGAHTLASTDAQIDAAFLQQASLQVGAQCAGALAAIGARLGIGELFNKNNERRLTAERTELVENYEKWRERLQPDSIVAQMKSRAESLHISFPKPDEYWVKIAPPTDPKLDPSEPLNQKRFYFKIVEVHENGWVEVVDLGDPDQIVQQILLSDMINPSNNFRKINNYHETNKIDDSTKDSKGNDKDKNDKDKNDKSSEGGNGDTDEDLHKEDAEKKSSNGSENPELSPENNLEQGEIQFEKKSYAHIENSVGKRLKPETQAHEIFKTAEVSSGDHLVVGIVHRDKNASLPEKLLEQITAEIISKYQDQDVQSNFHNKLEEITTQALEKFVIDTNLRKKFGLTIAITRPDGKYYAVWINNTKEIEKDNRKNIFHGHKLFAYSEDGSKIDLRYTNNKTRCEAQLKDNDRVGIFGKAFDRNNNPLPIGKLIESVSKQNIDLDERISNLYKAYVEHDKGVLPDELSIYFARYKETLADNTVNPIELLDTTKTETITNVTEEALKKSGLPWVDIRLMDKSGKFEKRAISLENGQIFFAKINGKDIFHEIIIDPAAPEKITLRAFGVDGNFQTHEAARQIEFHNITEFKAWLDSRQASFSANDKKGFEEELLKIKNR